MICASGLLDQTVTPSTTAGSLPVTTTLAPATAATTTTAPAASTTTPTVAKTTTTLAHTTTTLAHKAVVAATTTTVAPASNATNSDRGVIHQLFIDSGSTNSSAHSAQIYLAAPVKVILILVIAVILTRVVSRLSHRLVNSMRLVSPLVQATPRGAARVQTLAGAFTSIFRAVIWIIALLEILGEFSINLAPFIATATVIGAALGFGAQSLVKDFLSGLLILAEDQYGVGDHVAIGTGSNITSGTVESVNLRVTRLRGADGGILYVPNGDIRTISNDTETDSQALVDFVVPFGTDLVAAGVAAQEAAREMAADPEWAQEFVSEPFFAGVQDATNANGFVIRIMALTRPGQHLRMAREMRYRVAERLRQEHVAWVATNGAVPDHPSQEEVRKARAEKRAAEKVVADMMVGPAGRTASARGASKRQARKAAAKAMAKRVGSRKRSATPTDAPSTASDGQTLEPDAAADEAQNQPGREAARKDQPGDSGGDSGGTDPAGD